MIPVNDLKKLSQMKLPEQGERYSCGAAALKYALMYLGNPYYDESVIVDLADTTPKNGTDEDGLRAAAEKLGYGTTTLCYFEQHEKEKAFKGLVSSLLDNDCPIILCVDDFSHWVVAIGASDDGETVAIADPTNGNVSRYTEDELLDRWWIEDKNDPDNSQYFGLVIYPKEAEQIYKATRGDQEPGWKGPDYQAVEFTTESRGVSPVAYAAKPRKA